MERALAKSRDRHSAPRPASRRIRLMIVDDSMVARAVLSRMIESDPSFEIAAVAGSRRGCDRRARTGSGRHRPTRPRNAGPRRPQFDPPDPRCRRRGQGNDRILARRGRRRGDGGGARARSRRHPSQAGHRTVQRPLLGGPAGQAQGARLRPEARSPGDRAGSLDCPARASCNARRPDRRARGRRFDRRNPRARSPVSHAAQADRRSDPRHPAPSGSVHAGVCAAAARRLASRGDGRRGRDAAASRPHPARAWRCASDRRMGRRIRRSSG